jgi:hypothetical protein
MSCRTVNSSDDLFRDGQRVPLSKVEKNGPGLDQQPAARRRPRRIAARISKSHEIQAAARRKRSLYCRVNDPDIRADQSNRADDNRSYQSMHHGEYDHCCALFVTTCSGTVGRSR